MGWLILIYLLILLFVISILSFVVCKFFNYCVQMPMSKLDKELIDNTFTNNPQELDKFVNYGSMSRKELISINEHNDEKVKVAQTFRSINEGNEKINVAWIKHAYPLQQITVHLQGTRRSNRQAIINQLGTVIERLKNGDMQGEEHDDDFGYRFKVVAASEESFFKEPAGRS